MSEPRTLGEVLDKWEDKGRATFGPSWSNAAIHAFTADLRRILYGTDEPCPDPYHDHAFGHVGCPACVTGRIKTPGLVERVDTEYARGPWYDDETWRDCLRREIGEAP
jgi:hypothetical protein